MATMTGNDGTLLDAEPYTEHDKLGPLGSTRSVIDDAAALRRALIGEFEAAVDATKAAAASVDRNIAGAVHGYRKALRRARAVLTLVAPALPRGERRAVRRALRDARRALGTARDHAVAPDTMSLVTLDDTTLRAADAILGAAREAVPPLDEIRQLLDEGAARAAAQVEALEAALPPAIAWSTVLRGVRGVYKDARHARKAGKRSKRSFHTWRRRTKLLAYQIDVILSFAGDDLGALQRDLAAVTDAQGPAVDLIMLRDFIRTHAGQTSAGTLDALVDAIDGQLEERMRQARKIGRELFSKKPRRFAKRVDTAARSDVD
jgi:CHAD domain-containing protein